jgi:hypothetical protein
VMMEYGESILFFWTTWPEYFTRRVFSCSLFPK